VTTVLVGVKTLTTETTFSADATLLLNRQGARSSVLERNTRALPWIEVVESEIEVVQSSPVMQMALAKLTTSEVDGRFDMTLGELANSIEAGVVGESNVIYVTGTSADRALAPRITNAVAESYVEYHDQLFQLPNPMSMITARSDSVLTLLERLESERATILSNLGAADVQHLNKTLTTNHEQLRQEMADGQLDIARLSTQITDAREFLANREGVLPFTENTGSVQGGSMIDMVRSLTREKDNLRQLREKYTELHPLVVDSRHAVESLQSSVDGLVEELIKIREHELRVAENVAAKLRDQLGGIEDDIARVLQNTSRLGSLESRINALRAQYSALSSQSVESQITGESFRDYGVKILSPAIGAMVNAKADTVRLALGPILALMAGIGLAFYLENLDHSLTNRDDIEQHLEIPVLASFPDSEDARRDSPGSEDPVPYRRKGSRARG
jgi:polysaccharide biosynthesis transport protein